MINAPTQQALLAIMVHAAMADGDKSQAERDFVRDLSLQLDEQGDAKQLAQAVQAALLGRLSAQQAAAQLQDPMHRQLAYEWATAVCHADGLCSPAEAAFLQRLKTDLQMGKAKAEPEATTHTQALARAAYAEEAAAPLHAPAAVAAQPSAPTAPTALAAAPAAPAVDNAAIDRSILNYAILNGALELLPQSWASMAIIPLQIKMVYRMGQAHGVSLDQGHIKEFIAAAGVGLTSQYIEEFGRKLLGGLIGKAGGKLLGGLTSQATGMAFSFASTYALGHLAKRYYAGGRVMSTDLLRQTYQGLLGSGKTLQQQHLGDIRARASTLDAGEVMRMVRG
ncbi:YcjF family protein [Limnohabitans sp.]|uniref:YcjF family protein n=1 Tax=Limnohabitans sp. TaxID=1907725 RepID=UPI0037BFC770